MENLIKVDDLGVPLFLETPKYFGYIMRMFQASIPPGYHLSPSKSPALFLQGVTNHYDSLTKALNKAGYFLGRKVASGETWAP